MGYYLDSTEPFRLYQSTVKSPYFVDKSAMIAELLPLVETGNNHICITRPRRFGKSVAAAMIGAFFTLSDNQIASYWTQTGAYNEIASYIVNDVADVKEDIARMVAGERVRTDIDEYAAAAMELNTRDEIFSAMVVYGFLNYEKGYVSIPNHELRLEFARTIKKEPSMGYVNCLARASDAILQATLDGDEDAVAKALADVHKDTPIMA